MSLYPRGKGGGGILAVPIARFAVLSSSVVTGLPVGQMTILSLCRLTRYSQVLRKHVVRAVSLVKESSPALFEFLFAINGYIQVRIVLRLEQ